MRLPRHRFTVRRLLILGAALAIMVTGSLFLKRNPLRNARMGPEERKRFEEAYYASPEFRELGNRELRKIFGERGIAIVRGATRVETFRIDGRGRNTPDEGRVERIEGFPITAVGCEKGRDFASRLARRLLDGRIYCFIAPSCYPIPGVAFRLWMDKESVDLILCYECGDLEVYIHDASGRLIHSGGSFFTGPIESQSDQQVGPDVLGSVEQSG